MNKEKFDITCTATLRPELLDKTLSSFTKYLFRERISCSRLIINIDMVGARTTLERYGDELDRLNQINDIISLYPFYETIINVGDGNFPAAFCWCMDKINSRYFFHLEDDWELLFPIDFEEMWNLFEEHLSLAHLRLSAFVSKESTCKNWNKFLYWNSQFFEVKEEEKFTIGWAGHPSLNRTSFIKKCLPYINKTKNPEKQIKGRIHPIITGMIGCHRFGSYHPQNTSPSIIDIGRRWMVDNGWVKSGNKAFFVKWERNK